MKRRITGSYPLTVERIVFNDGTTMENTTVILTDPFLVVEGADGERPSMYNINAISALIGVQEIRPEAPIRAW